MNHALSSNTEPESSSPRYANTHRLTERGGEGKSEGYRVRERNGRQLANVASQVYEQSIRGRGRAGGRVGRLGRSVWLLPQSDAKRFPETGKEREGEGLDAPPGPILTYMK